jgi:mono/diheme cytochrome c family protein
MRLFLAIVGFCVLPLASGFAQGDAKAGKKIADRSCAQCHDIEAGDRDNFRIAPTFQTVADDPAVTEPALRTFFETPHVSDPAARLTARETTDVLTYLLTLKRSRPRG